MKILNLVYPDKSQVKFKSIKFPDGQQQIVITDLESVKVPIWEISPKEHPFKEAPKRIDSVEIKSRLNNFSDLELIICATKSLRKLKVKDIYLNIPYLLGSRSDIQFEEGSNNYLKDILAPILNSLKFNNIICTDVHSIAAENCINNLEKLDNYRLVKWALGMMNKSKKLDEIILISPDAGANKKIYKLAESINYYDEIVTCTKIRDVKSGKIITTKVPISWSNTDVYRKDKIIIDDICDGGRTFIEITKVIKEYHDGILEVNENSSCKIIPGKIYLIVTHGIFSKGFSELSQYFDGIYCTNSYGDLEAISFESSDKGNHKVKVEDFVKQLNAF